MSNLKRALVLILLLAGCTGPPPAEKVAVEEPGTIAALDSSSVFIAESEVVGESGTPISIVTIGPTRASGPLCFDFELFDFGMDFSIALSPICAGCGQWIPEETEDRVTLRNELIELDPHADCGER